MPNVFLSSAVGDDDPYVAEFFHDLRRALARLTANGSTDEAFLGTAGSDLSAWPGEMARSLARCDVFLALCSRRYFLSEACGRQWQVFDERLRLAEQQSGQRPPALIALAWTLDVEPTDAAVAIDGPPGGLRQMVRLRSRRADYQAFVGELAERIDGVARAHRVPRLDVLPSFAATPSAFAGGEHENAPHVHFVVLTGTRPEMAEVRESLVFYGKTREEWKPYFPTLAEPLADRAQAVAADHLFESEVGSIDDIVDRIARARHNDEIVVVLVDGWATQLETYQRLLVEIDRRGLGDAAVLAPTSQTDLETVKNRDELRYGMRWAFKNSTVRPDALLRTEIETPDRFDAELAGVIEEARNRIFREGRVRQLPSGSPGERPILSGP